jgi:predicted nucleic acid-binding protein
VDRGRLIVADTDVLLDAFHGEGAHARVAALARTGRLATTAITVYEIWRGLDSADAVDRARRAFRGIRVYPLNAVAARHAAELERRLEGSPIGERDTLIAGICLAVQRPLLTANVRHFRRVRGLDVVQAR